MIMVTRSTWVPSELDETFFLFTVCLLVAIPLHWQGFKRGKILAPVYTVGLISLAFYRARDIRISEAEVFWLGIFAWLIALQWFMHVVTWYRVMALPDKVGIYLFLSWLILWAWRMFAAHTGEEMSVAYRVMEITCLSIIVFCSGGALRQIVRES